MAVVKDLGDDFPVGMRVLAVDDDRTCLKILERNLQSCQYHVTTATNATTALKLLREKKDEFDLVISDVHMPDMDGFKLLELVGLEIDLPVIMLSANDDQKMVLKGISHGAVDYLLKPVRLKELQIIWRHVIRKKKETNKTGKQSSPNADSNGLDLPAVTTNSNQNENPSRKIKDQRSDEDVDDTEDPTTHKKPRVVWNADLHRKFVAAVNKLGVDKAVPKKILDLMNVEKLTRENVASHLQKYRLYLKRISNAENQQANMVADTSYYGNLHSWNGPRQFSSNVFRDSGMSSRLNTPPNVHVQGLPSFGTLQLSQAHNLNNSTNDQLKFQSTAIRCNPNGVQGMPNMTSKLPDYYKAKVTFGCTSSQVFGIPNNALMLDPKKVGGEYENLASHHNSQFLNNDVLSSAILSPATNSYLSRDTFGHAAMPHTDNNMTFGTLQGSVNLSGSSSINPMTNIDLQGVFGNVSFQGWNNHHSHVIGSSVGSLIPVNAAEPQGNLDCENSLRANEVYMMNKSQSSGISSNNLASLEDMVNAMIKQKQD